VKRSRLFEKKSVRPVGVGGEGEGVFRSKPLTIFG